MQLLSEHFLHKVLNIAEAAGLHLMRFSQQNVKVNIKPDNTPVTEADIFSHDFITQQLTALTPHIPILSEENIDIPLAQRQHWQQYWLIDPLDGTSQFIEHSNQFSVLISLMQHNQPILGIIHAPALHVSYFAMKNGGAFKKQAGHIKQLLPQFHTDKEEINIVFGVKSLLQPIKDKLNPRFKYQFHQIGSCGLKAGLVAEGTFDCYFRLGKTGEWDTAPAEILLAETGGMIKDLNFNDLLYNQRETLINPSFIMFNQNKYNWNDVFQLNH